MDNETANIIYGVGGRSLMGSVIGYFVGLLIIVGGFIFASRYLIGKRVRRFEQEWRASHRPTDEADPRHRQGNEKPPPADR